MVKKMIGRIGLSILLTMILIMPALSAESSFPSYLQKLDDEKAKVRLDAAWSLGKSGDASAIQPLIRHLDDPDRDVREWVVLALASLGQPSVDPLIEALSHDSALVRWQAAAALGLIKDRRAAEPLILALRDRSADTRYWSAISLGEINDSIARDPLIQALADANATIGDAAGWALLETEGSAAVDLLKIGRAHV